MALKSGIAPEVMTALPRSDGASIESLRAPLSTNLNLGTFAYKIAIDVPRGRREGELEIALVYELRAYGNGPFGVGWSVPELAIERRIDGGMPAYDNTDRFQLTDGTELHDLGGGLFGPTNERAFRRIRFVGPHWEVTNTDGTRLLFGLTEQSRLFDPADPARVAAWRLEQREDPNGNVVRYGYMRDLDVRRPEGFAAGQLYLRSIEYVNSGNLFMNAVRFDYRPRPDAWTTFRRGFPIRTRLHCYQIATFTTNLDAAAARIVDFGGVPIVAGDGRWDDTWLAGAVYLQRSASAPEVTLDFPLAQVNASIDLEAGAGGASFRLTTQAADGGENVVDVNIAAGVTAQALGAEITRAAVRVTAGQVRLRRMTIPAPQQPMVHARYKFTFRDLAGVGQVNAADLAPPMLMLSTVQRFAVEPNGAERGLPPASIHYSPLALDGIYPRRIDGSPNEPLGRNTSLIGFFGTGRPDIFQTEAGHRAYFNVGLTGAAIRVAGRDLVNSPATRLDSPDVFLRDVRGRGAVDLTTTDLFHPNPSAAGPVSRTQPAWEAAVQFDPVQRHPQLAVAQLPRTRSIDLDGDGRPDLLTTDEVLREWRNEGGGAWSAEATTTREFSFGDSTFPNVSFDDERIFIADMNGDGLDEIVRVNARKVEYWVRDGSGWSHGKTTMANAPRFADFDPRRVILTDLTGSGVSDLVYVHANGLELALNIGGERFAKAVSVSFNNPGLTHGVPMPNATDAMLAVDFLGDGTRGLLWSFRRLDIEPNYFYLPLCAAGKPYLLASIDNGLGGSIEVDYATSTELAAADELAGNPWDDEPPYPATVITGIREIDQITGDANVRSFRYRNGYYDRADREFRGFSLVEEIFPANASRRGLRVQHRFHPGKPAANAALDRIQARAMAGSEMRTTRIDLALGTVLSDVYHEYEIARVQKWQDPGGGAAWLPAAPLDTADGDPVVCAFERRRLECAVEGTAAPHYSLKEFNRLVTVAGNDVLDEFGRLVSETRYGEVLPGAAPGAVLATLDVDGAPVDFGAGTPEEQVRITHEYAIGRAEHIVRYESHQVTRQGPNFNTLIAEERNYYDGGTNPGDFLPLGETVQGNLQRRERFNATEADLTAIFGAAPVAALGPDEDTAPGFFLRDNNADGAASLFVVMTRRVFQQAAGRIAFGAILRELNARGAETRRIFDAATWYLRTERNALGHERRFEAIDYRAGRASLVRDANNVRTEVLHDGFGREISIREDTAAAPLPQREVVFDDAAFANGRPTSNTERRLIDNTENPRRYRTEVVYKDGWGRELQSRRSSESNGADFLVTAKRYAAGGSQPTFEAAPYWQAGIDYQALAAGQRGISRTRDGLSRVNGSSFPDGNVSRIDYEPWRAVIRDSSDLDPASDVFDTPTTIQYDYANRPRRVELAVRHGAGFGVNAVAVTDFVFDGGGRLLRLVDARGSTIRYDYDANGEVLRVRHPDAGQILRLFAADGIKVFERNEAGDEWWYEYDALGRVELERRGGIAAPVEVDYTYDAGPNGIGRLTSVVSNPNNNVVLFEYDGQGNVVRRRHMIDGVVEADDRMDYCDLRKVRRATSADGSRVDTSYSLDGLPVAMELVRAAGQRVPLMSGVRYHTSGRVRQATLSGGNVTFNAAFDAATQRLMSQTYTTGSGTAFAVDGLAYDRVGNVRTFTEHAPPGADTAWQFEYDSLYRVRHATARQGANVIADYFYQYDLVGNFTRNDEYRVNDAWQYSVAQPDVVTGTAAAPNTVVTDAAGRVTATAETAVLQWNARKRVSRVTSVAGDRVDVRYDHEGNLLVADRTPAGALAATRSAFFSKEHEMQAGTHIYHATLDGVPWVSVAPDGQRRVLARTLAQSVVRELDDAGAVIAGRDEAFAPFGRRMGNAPALEKQRGFAGAVQGAGQVMLMGARPYQLGFGRFLAVDPLLQARIGEDLFYEPGRMSPYAYALNSPRTVQDPSGELAFVDDFVFWLVGTVFGARNDNILSGTWQNFVESWKLVLGTFNTFNTATDAGSFLLGVARLLHKLTWGLPNEVLGIVAGYFAVEVAGGTTRFWQNVQVVDLPGTGGAFTLGSKVIGDAKGIEKHEQGHYHQNLLLGPLYLAVIAIPSVIHYAYWNVSGGTIAQYHNFYTEAWADAWS